CRNCFAKKTSKWRKDGNGHVACSACYLYFRKHKKNRPRELQDLKDMKSCYYCNTYLGFESYDHSCSNCQTADTSVWQFDVVGRRICNACYQYHEIHGVNRPPYLRREHVLERSQ
ncbi:hypothetical protein BKA81DRAFT_274945, partial [Phyllosticta paracitricarpa]